MLLIIYNYRAKNKLNYQENNISNSLNYQRGLKNLPGYLHNIKTQESWYCLRLWSNTVFRLEVTVADDSLDVISYEIYQVMTQDNDGSAIHRKSLQFKVHCIWDGKPYNLTSVSSTTHQRMAILWYKNLFQLHYCFGSRWRFLTSRTSVLRISIPGTCPQLFFCLIETSTPENFIWYTYFIIELVKHSH